MIRPTRERKAMLYDFAFLIFSIFYLPTLLFKGKLHRNFLERFGVYDKNKRTLLNSTKGAIWIQAVSVGEVGLCRSLVPLLKEKFSDSDIVLSTITKTGYKLAKKIFFGDAIIIYFPLDFGFIVKRVVALIKPKIYIMIETEIWPNLLDEIHQKDIPSILINGRISGRSFGKYKFVRSYLKNILTKVDRFCMQSEVDADRIIYLGAPQDKVSITGNMKFDIGIEMKTGFAQKTRTVLNLDIDEQLFVAGSTHRGEEEMIVKIFKGLIKEFPKLKLLIAPRHIERANEVEKSVRRFGLESIRVSKGQSAKGSKIFILDTIGQLKSVYSIATIVFVGGSLVRHGGQNMIEPAIFERPILFGPHTFNFEDITKRFLDGGAAIRVVDEKNLLEKITFLLKDDEARAKLGSNAKKVVSDNCGAAKRNLEAICEILYTR